MPRCLAPSFAHSSRATGELRCVRSASAPFSLAQDGELWLVFHRDFAKQGRSEDSSCSPTDATKVISGLVWGLARPFGLPCLERAGSQLAAVLGKLSWKDQSGRGYKLTASMAREVRMFDRTLLEAIKEGVVPRPGLLTYQDWNSWRSRRQLRLAKWPSKSRIDSKAAKDNNFALSLDQLKGLRKGLRDVPDDSCLWFCKTSS